MSTNNEKANYRFFPWVREGYRPYRIFNPDTSIEGNDLNVVFEIRGYRGYADSSVRKSVILDMYGPGEIIDINPDQIVGTEPKPHTTEFPPNYFPTVEFDRVDLPWLFTPVSADQDGRVPPWLCLIVVRQRDGVTITPSGPNKRSVLEIADDAGDELPNLSESWAWAHVQTVGGPDTSSGVITWARQEFETNSIHTRSRLIAPRRLEANQSYHACLVPTFEAGVNAGLGELPSESPEGSSKTFDWAWDFSNPPTSIRLPVYYSWDFTAGLGGDFEALARELDPQRDDEKLKGLGFREIDVTDPGPTELVLSEPTTVRLEGALRSRTLQSKSYPEDAKANLATYLNQTFESSDWDNDKRPAFGPPGYGTWHVGSNDIPYPADPDYPWLSELNLDPRHRIAAGLGTAVIQENQEQLLASAWSQLGAVRQANELLSRARLARAASSSIYEGLCSQSATSLLGITRPLHDRLFWNQRGTTIHAHLAESRVPEPSLSSTLRRILRSGGPLSSRLSPRSVTQEEIIEALDDGYQFESPTPPSGMKTFDTVEVADLTSRLCTRMKGLHKKIQRERHGYFEGISLEEISLEPLFDNCRIIDGLLSRLFDATGSSTEGELAGELNVIWELIWSDPSDPLIERYEIACMDFDYEKAINIFREILRLLTMVHDRLLRLRQSENANVKDLATELEKQYVLLFDERLDKVGSELAEAPSDPLLERLRPSVCRSPPNEDLGPELDPSAVKQPLEAGLSPEQTIQNRINARIDGLDLMTRARPLGEIMAAPRFKDPMYLPLKDLSENHLLPGVADIPKNSLGALKSNPKFVESYLVGLNHEMARELRWRGFPTDMRGTYFRRFWDRRGKLPTPTPDELDDIGPIHGWRTDVTNPSGSGKLGDNHRQGTNPDRAVFVVRGELLRRYPETVIYAVRAEPDGDTRKPKLPEIGQNQPSPDNQDVQFPAFRGEFDPDITFLGFDLTPKEARSGDGDLGWFFVLQEPPGEPRFGLDADPGEDDTDVSRYPAGVRLSNGAVRKTPRATDEEEGWSALSWNHIIPHTESTPESPARADLIEKFTYVPVNASAPSGDDGQGGEMSWETGSEDNSTMWGKNSAHMASIMWQQPFRISVHADDLLPQEEA